MFVDCAIFDQLIVTSCYVFTGEITIDNNVDREISPMFKLTVRAGQAKCDEVDKNDTGNPSNALPVGVD